MPRILRGAAFILAAVEQRRCDEVLFSNDLDRQMSALAHLASAVLVAAFFAAMLVSANLFTEYRSMKIPAVRVLEVKAVPL